MTDASQYDDPDDQSDDDDDDDRTNDVTVHRGHNRVGPVRELTITDLDLPDEPPTTLRIDPTAARVGESRRGTETSGISSAARLRARGRQRKPSRWSIRVLKVSRPCRDASTPPDMQMSRNLFETCSRA